MSVHVSPEELEYLRTAPAKAINRSGWRGGRARACTPDTSDDIGSSDSPEDSIELEKWREYCQYESGKHMQLPQKIKRLWKQVTCERDGIRNFLVAAGRGVLQMGMVWGAGFWGLGVGVQQTRKETEW